MIVAPFHSPTRVNRRLTPPKPASALRMTSALTPSACATAIAAVAFNALWRPGIGKVKLVDLVCAFSVAVAEEDGEIATRR